MTPDRPLLVVAGEPSGDRAIAAIVRALGARAIGLGGDALAGVGAELVGHVRELSAMGLAELPARAPGIARAIGRLIAAVRRARPAVAILASWSSANAAIGPLLRRAGLRVVWVSPPEVWAWGAGRARRLARAADVLVPTLPFEESIWRAAGADARYLGHPALDAPAVDRPALRRTLGLHRRALAVLPGSRPGEIARMLDAFVGAAVRLDLDARVIAAPSLDRPSRARIAEASAQARIPVVDAPAEQGASALLPAFDVALVASGTASLEAALAGVPPVVAYAMHPLTMRIARRVVTIDRIALPNVLLARAGLAPVFVERLQDEVHPSSLAAAVAATLADPARRAACDAVRGAMSAHGGPWAARVAEVVAELARNGVPARW